MKKQRKRKRPEVWTVHQFVRPSLTDHVLPLIQGDSILDLFRVDMILMILGLKRGNPNGVRQ